jgi:hypothetical protein
MITRVSVISNYAYQSWMVGQKDVATIEVESIILPDSVKILVYVARDEVGKRMGQVNVANPLVIITEE